MKICLAQTRPHRGDIKKNIEDHLELVRAAVSKGANYIFFPELSLTGYEPELAEELAISLDSQLLDAFEKLSDQEDISVGIGVPLLVKEGVQIAMIVFRPKRARFIYAKQYLHEDELPFFVPGTQCDGLIDDGIALAICYELSVPDHVTYARKNGAKIYVASVAKTKSGVEEASHTLSKMAKKHSMITLMVNCVGESGDGLCTGKSAIWVREGKLISRLSKNDEGLLLYDTDLQVASVID